jgi:hypothetical protein
MDGLDAAVVPVMMRNSPKTAIAPVAEARVVPMLVQPAVVVKAVTVVSAATALNLRNSPLGVVRSREPFDDVAITTCVLSNAAIVASVVLLNRHTIPAVASLAVLLLKLETTVLDVVSA